MKTSKNSLTPILLTIFAGAVIFPTLARANNNVVLYASKAPVRAGTWKVVADSTAAGGFAIANPISSAPKLTTALASPQNYFQMTFPAYSHTAYHLWIRGKSADNSYLHDSVYVQFSDSLTSSGAAIDRMGTTSATPVALQACNGAAIAKWGWTDNGWCGLGPNIYFSSTGTHTIRIQVRSSGLSIDQIVLSPQTYLSAAPGSAVNNTTILAANLPSLTSTTLSVSVSSNPSSGSAPLGVNFGANLSGATPSSYKWSFGDGGTATSALPSHVYQSAGNYTAKVTVTDTAGASASAFSLVSVGGASSQSKLRVVQANIQYGGQGTDNVINLTRIADWLVKMNPDVASLTEVIGGWNDPALITSLMKQKTGLTWYNYYVPKFPGCAEGVMILSKWPIVSTKQYFMSYQMPIAEATLKVGGKLVSFFATHFQWPKDASAERQVEANQLVTFTSQFAEPRIVAGDLNAQVGTPEVDTLLAHYSGGWDTAVNKGVASGYADNPPNLSTRTRRSRIDHILYSGNVSVTAAEVPDQRAPNTASKVVEKIGTSDDYGVRPSDHNFMEVTFDVN